MTNWYSKAPLCFLFLLFLSISAHVSGRDIYVDNLRGNDNFLGYETAATNENGPVRTIRRALQLAEASDCIILANNPDHPYRESVSLYGNKNSGVPDYPFRIIGNGATIDGTTEIPPSYWHAIGQNGIFVYRPQYLAYQNLFYRGKPVRRLKTDGVKTLEELVKLDWQPMRWCMFNGHVYFKPREAYMIHADGRFLPYDDSVAAQKRAYSLTAPEKQYGIALEHVEYVTIEDVIIQGFQNDGIIASDSATYISLKNVTCRGNARAGLSVGTGSSIWLKGCVLGNNQYAQLVTEEASLTSIFASDLISYPAPAWVTNGGTVYRDKKRIEGGLNEPVDTVFEDEEDYFGEPGEAETELVETELPEETDVEGDAEDDGGLFDGDDDDSEEDSGDDDGDDDGGLFGGDNDDSEEDSG
ncbi:MAG: right-handed parallel beta-helix repeat-containing protein, partial [Planctomycetia bacterium]|nr:right-handed parallel beta-helix repeat-containing protein [Planctomycetia bacterium]